MTLRLISIILLFLSIHAPAQSIFSSKNWYKVGVTKEGVHKITYDQLIAAGLQVGSVNPANFRMYGDKGGMLPQSNAILRNDDPQEIPLKIVGGSDNSFDPGDYILFYAYGPDKWHYSESLERIVYERNLYSRSNFYFLTVDQENGIRVSSQANLGAEHAELNSYTDYFYYEKEDLNLLSSGRKWYGRLGASSRLDLDLPFDNLAAEGNTTVHAEVMGQTTEDASFEITINGQFLGNIPVSRINDFNERRYRFRERGRDASGTFTIGNNLIQGANPQVQLNFQQSGGAFSIGYFDYLLVQADRNLRYQGEPIIATLPQAASHALITVSIENLPSSGLVWDVTDEIREQETVRNGNVVTFGTVAGEVKKITIFEPDDVPSAEILGAIPNQNLKGKNTPDLLIISHTSFLSEIDRLAQFRRSNDNLDVLVVTTNMIFNEFSSGRQDVVAIRDYIKYLYEENPAKLKYVLLVGRGSYDYLDYQDNNTNFVPIYQSRNVLEPVRTYGSDDFYGFLEDHEGDWEENSSGNHTLDVAVGRLPVTSNEKLAHIIDKLIHYATSPNTLGSWRSRGVYVADDEDGNAFHEQTEQLSAFAENNINYLKSEKLYLGAFSQVLEGSQQRSPKASQALLDAIDKGSLFVNFIGHGNEVQWTDEAILLNENVDALDNLDNLPLFVTATCEFGRHDNPDIISGGERLILNSNGGGIALVTTSRPVFASSNYALNEAFFEGMKEFLMTSGRVGDIFRYTKNNSLINVNNRNFTLLGDPSMKLAVPEYQITLDNLEEGDTLKALSRMNLHGSVTDPNGIVNTFNGNLELIITDKPVEKETLEDPAFQYTERSSYLFRGSATVTSGEFTVEFIVPRDIRHRVGEGQMYFYATDGNTKDAAGNFSVKVGGTADVSDVDTQGPQMTIFMGDTTFTGGDMVGSDALLLVRLEDPSGINITGQSIGTGLYAELDGNYIDLNEHYVADQDNFTKGTIRFLLKNLSPGEHTLTLVASDAFNNISTKSISFRVLDNLDLIIEELYNAPNPVSEGTAFFFTHNRAGESLEGELEIFRNNGEKLLHFNFEIDQGQVRHRIMDWDRGRIQQLNLGEGIYYYRLKVRSLVDGATAHETQKFILVK